MKKILLITVCIVLSGCADPYTKNYTDATGGRSVLENPDVIVPTNEPRLIRGSNIENVEKDNKRMIEDGYAQLGYSGFTSRSTSQEGALRQAVKIHADTVIAYCAYADTVSGMMPLTVPDTQTSYHSGSIYGSGGGSAHYSGSSTTYGSQTTYMPYSVDWYHHLATYWIKLKRLPLGIYVHDLTDELRKIIESNKGVYVIAVVKGSPAFENDILVGDVIRKINNTEVTNKEHFATLMNEHKGEKIELEVFRNGETLLKQVQLN